MHQQIQQALADNDDTLKEIIQMIPFPEIESTHHVFNDLMSCVIEQQIHYRSSKKVFQKMLDRAELEVLTPEHFPVFEEKGIADTKLSGRKYETISHIVGFFQQHQLDWTTKEDSEVRKTLSQIKGVGNWSIDMVLIYTLERPDILPADDYHLKQIMVKLYTLNPNSRLKAQIKQVAESWKPYRSTAVKYLLAWKKFQKKGMI